MLPTYVTIYYHLDGAVHRRGSQDEAIALDADAKGVTEFEGDTYNADVYWDTHGRVDIYLTAR